MGVRAKIGALAGAGGVCAFWGSRTPESGSLRNPEEEEACRRLGLMTPAEAQRTKLVRVPRFLSAAEVDEVTREIRSLGGKCGTIERSPRGSPTFMGPWSTTYLHTNNQFKERLSSLRSKLKEAGKAVDADHWRMLDDMGEINFRTAFGRGHERATRPIT